MITVEQGHIVLVPFPYSNLRGTKTRPALVVSNEQLKGDDIIVCAITSRNLKKQGVGILDQDLEKGRLPVISYIRPEKIFTLEKLLIRKIVAKISAEKLQEVSQELTKLTMA